MKHPALLLSVAILLLLVHTAGAADGRPTSGETLKVIEAQSARIYYDADEPVTGRVVLENGGGKTQRVRVSVWLEADLDRKTTPRTRDVVLAAGKRASIEFHWPKASLGLYGYAMKWQVERDEAVTMKGADYFTICDNYWNVALTYTHPFGYTARYSTGQIAQQLRRLRARHYNGFERFFWAPDDFADMTPQRDVYYSGQVRYYESKPNIRFMIEEGHRLGMRAITYGKCIGSGTAGAEFARAHPQWVRLEGGRLAMEAKVRSLHYWDAEKNWSGKNGSEWQDTNWVFYDMNSREVVDYGADEILRSAKMFGWDGVRFDGHFRARSSWTDLNGKTTRLTPAECDALTADNVSRTKRRIGAELPKFVFGYNYLNGQCARELAGGSREFAELCRGGGHLMNEYIGQATNSNHPQHRWEDFATVLADDTQIVRRLGGHHFPILNYRGVDHWYSNAIAYAAGAHPYYSHVWGAFATRHAGILWDRALERINNPAGLIVAPLNLWWQRFVHRRRLGNGRQQIIVHLINPPISPVIRNDAKDENLPARVRDVAVEIFPRALAGGPWKLTKAALLDPDVVSVDEADIRAVQGVVTVTVPELRVWKVLVLDFSTE